MSFSRTEKVMVLVSDRSSLKTDNIEIGLSLSVQSSRRKLGGYQTDLRMKV